MDDSLTFRAAQHAALGDPHRLAIVDALTRADFTPGALGDQVLLSSNLLAFHLRVLADAQIIRRVRSEGDRRRRYVALHENAPQMSFSLTATATPVLFVCTRNQARSQFAAALFEQHTGIPAFSAGARPAQAPDPEAVAVAAHSGLDPSRWTTCSYNDITTTPAVVISVCDRAYEAGMPFTGELRHWSIPDPAGQPRAQYEHTLRQLNARITRLVVNQNQAISA